MSFIGEKLTDWTHSITASHRAQLVTTAVVSGAVVATGIFAFQAARYHARLGRLKGSITGGTSEHDSLADQVGFLDAGVMHDSVD